MNVVLRRTAFDGLRKFHWHLRGAHRNSVSECVLYRDDDVGRESAGARFVDETGSTGREEWIWNMEGPGSI